MSMITRERKNMQKCSLKSDCQGTARNPLWISYKSDRCTTITSVKPNRLQRTTTKSLYLEIEDLPTLAGQLECAFSAMDQMLVTNATRTVDGVSCTTPPTDRIPHNKPGRDHIKMKLSVRMATGPVLVATNFTFFDCSTYSSCIECTSSSYPCDWCVDGHRCTHDVAKNCHNDIHVTRLKNRKNKNKRIESLRSGPGFCPRINATASGSTKILFAHGTKKSIRVKVENIAQFIMQTDFECLFAFDGRMMRVGASLLGDTIYCDDIEFTYLQPTPNQTAMFSVIWGGSKPIDNPNNVYVLIYRCSEMADNCGLCHTLSPEFMCGWCQTSDKCEIQEQCDGSGMSGSVIAPTDAAWLDRSQICPNPQVLDFQPRMGPWEGGTNLTIEGVNLGKTFNDIKDGITVAGMPCHPFESLYVETQRIVCLVDSPGKSDPLRGPVVVRVGASPHKGESTDYFQFVDPIIESISPEHGPQSGGTQLTIRGHYMNAGSSIQAMIDPDLPCIITATNATHTICHTSASVSLSTGELRMTFDNATRRFSHQMYRYVKDPTITSVEWRYGGRPGPRGIPAGGIINTVKGSNFHYIQNPKMYVHYGGVMHSSSCVVLSESHMECRSPSFGHVEFILPEDPIELDYGFLMDDVPSLQNISKQAGFSRFLLYPDPVYEKFEKGVKYLTSGYMVISGYNLNLACQETDIEAKIGTEPCYVVSLGRSQLTCQAPSVQPQAKGSRPSDPPEVVVIVGGNLHVVLGKLVYKKKNRF